MPIRKLREFLDSHAVRYFVVSHSAAYTAQEIAAAAHVPGKELAKTVIVTIAGKMAMVVLPASRQLDFELLRNLPGPGMWSLPVRKSLQDCFLNAKSVRCRLSATFTVWMFMYRKNLKMMMKLLSMPELILNCCGFPMKVTRDWSIR